MKRFVIILLFVPLISIAQDISGIKFEQGLTWTQIKAKAKAEKKYIFVDCYATWCGPCKAMDRNVYTDKMVGKYINEKFVSVKVQMDTTENDDKFVRQWYEEAHNISIEYDIIAYPIFLFFDSDCKLVHKEIGFKKPEEFILLAKIASDPNKQYYSLLKDYQDGKKNFNVMPYLAKKALQLKQKELAVNIAQDYLQNHLYKKKQDILYQIQNLEFIKSFVQSSKERGFKLFYKHPEKIDNLIGQSGASFQVLDNVIIKEDVNPLLESYKIKNDNPNWSFIFDKIKGKYGVDYAERIVLNSQLRWYQYKKDWSQQAAFQIKKIEKYGLDTSELSKAFTNNMIWNVFFIHCNSKTQLGKAIEWMQVILKSEPYDVEYLDTYANLLYKSGRYNEAINYETIATKLDPENKDLRTALEEMKIGEPTYIKEGAVWDKNTLPKSSKVSKTVINEGR